MRVLHFFTEQYPYGKGEAFVEDQIFVLSNYFDRILIYPLQSEKNSRQLPKNVSVVQVSSDHKANISITEIINLVFIFLFSAKKSRAIWVYLKNWKKYLGILMKNLRDAKLLHRSLVGYNKDIDSEHFFCTFWFSDWATSLSILKQNGIIQSFTSMAHSFDIYEEYFWQDQIIPFRAFQLKHVSNVHPDSIKGEKYLKSKYPEYATKINKLYMGGMDYGINKFLPNGVLKILSCSFVHKRKRVHRIFDAIEKLDFPIKWIHIGDGPDLDQLKERARNVKSKHEIQFKGYLSKTEMLNVYQDNSIDVFVHLSEKEGVPTAVIDAASFGVPLVATDAGGTDEIVNDSTGILLDINFKDEDLIKVLSSFLSSKMSTNDFRLSVKSYWSKNYNAEVNYKAFYNRLSVNSNSII